MLPQVENASLARSVVQVLHLVQLLNSNIWTRTTHAAKENGQFRQIITVLVFVRQLWRTIHAAGGILPIKPWSDQLQLSLFMDRSEAQRTWNINDFHSSVNQSKESNPSDKFKPSQLIWHPSAPHRFSPHNQVDLASAISFDPMTWKIWYRSAEQQTSLKQHKSLQHTSQIHYLSPYTIFRMLWHSISGIVFMYYHFRTRTIKGNAG